jgi:hypothetical protein
MSTEMLQFEACLFLIYGCVRHRWPRFRLCLHEYVCCRVHNTLTTAHTLSFVMFSTHPVKYYKFRSEILIILAFLNLTQLPLFFLTKFLLAQPAWPQTIIYIHIYIYIYIYNDVESM